MKCNHCGAEILDDSVFCEHCGKKIGEDTPNATNNDKKKLAMWIGIAAAAVVAVLLLVLLIGKGGSPAESPEELFNRLNAEEQILVINPGSIFIGEDNANRVECIDEILKKLKEGEGVEVEACNDMLVLCNMERGEDGRVIALGQNVNINSLKALAKEFLSNPHRRSDFSATKDKYIQFSESGSPERYPVSQGIITYNKNNQTNNRVRDELLKAVYELRDELSIKKYGVSFRDLTEEYQSRAIREAIPLAICEIDEDLPLMAPPPPPEPEEPESWENSERIEVPTVADDEVEEVSVSDDKVFSVVETDPEFPGGMEALYQYLASNLHYPQLARDNGITGKVYVTFVVEKDGRVTNPRILRDIGGGCGDEAIRVVKSMPRWSPGKQRGKPVRVQFNLPVNFNLK